MDTITLWLNNAGRRSLDQTETTELLARLSRTEDKKIRAKLVNRICEGNLRLLYSTVKAYATKRNIPWGSELSMDLLQAGFFGLHHAVGRYDAKYGTKLSTIAVPWIKQKLGRYMNTKERPIYIPEGLVREVNYVKKHGKPSGSKATPKDPQLLELARRAMVGLASLDRVIGDDGYCIADTVAVEVQEEQADPSIELKRLLEQANIKPNVREMVLIYTQGGRLDAAARKCNVNTKAARMLYNAAVARMKELV